MRELNPDHDPWDWAAVELRRQRELRGRYLKDVAKIIGRTESLVSKLESGDTPLQLAHATALDTAWATGGLLARIVRLAQSRHDGEWVAETVRREEAADRLSVWSLGWIPALLQTPEYARAVFVGCGVSGADEEVEKRIRRQSILERADVKARFLVAENALTDPIGGPDVQRAQLLRLLEVCDRHPVRVVPRTTGSHPGKDGSFTIYSKSDRDTAVWATTLGPGRLVTDATEIASYRVWFDGIGDHGLPLAASLTLIGQLVEDFA